MISFGPAMLIGLVFMGIGLLVSWRLRSKFQEFSKIPSRSGLSGREIAERMLRDYGIYDVRVTCVPGQLTDHYNPADKTVNLSEEVYHGTNAASAAVAAHECGHAVQHAKAYAPLEWRSKLVPLQHASGMFLNILMMLTFIGGAILFESFPIKWVLWAIVIAYGFIALFSIVTLPVELDASKRALSWIEHSGTATKDEYERSKTALNLAATTYVVAALGAIVTMFYYVLRLIGTNDD
ncbi:zinc metallopeptidase [Fluviicola sp.]|uniref:zinc metallopeptidase n=1 Tax=Fluviicola sp. TaxID=1917219 RepID=UPI0031E206E4